MAAPTKALCATTISRSDVSQIPIFHARISLDGKLLQLDPNERRVRENYLRRLAGKDVDVIIRKHQNRRSVNQNAWAWGIAYPIIANALGYDADEIEIMHYALVDLCFGTTFDARVGREVPNVRSSLIDTETYSGYMEWLVRWSAREHGIVVPLPNEAMA